MKTWLVFCTLATHTAIKNPREHFSPNLIGDIADFANYSMMQLGHIKSELT